MTAMMGEAVDNSTTGSDSHFDVLVAGAGLVGALFAALLATRDSGLRIALLEAQPFRGWHGDDGFDPRVVALNEAARRQLEAAKVWPSIVSRRVCPYRAMAVWELDGTGRIEFDGEEVGQPDIGHIIENSVVVAALLERLSALNNVTLYCPAVVNRIKDDSSGTRVTLTDGRILAASLLVAADGARSKVRELAGFSTRSWDYGHYAIVTTVRMEQPHGGVARQCFGSHGPLALLPLRGNDGDCRWISIVWSQDEQRAHELMTLDDEDFALALARDSESCLGRVERVDRRHCFPLRQSHAVDYTQPGIALIGDAAHSIHPLAGQGANLGFQDAAVLCDEILRARERGVAIGHPLTLQRYQRRRKSDNLAMMAAMEGFKRLFEADQPALRLLRNQGMNLLDGLASLKRIVIKRAMGL